MIELVLRCAPPSTTAQQGKRVRVVRTRSGRYVPTFYRSAAIKRASQTWATLLQPFVPRAPLTGPVSLGVCLVYPHLARTSRGASVEWRAKTSKPDVGNAVKEIEDVLVKLHFLEDDQQVSRLTAEKWHGPADQVGIYIRLAPLLQETPR
jgi:Holliday junction resolvase RusA-like endonuclease